MGYAARMMGLVVVWAGMAIGVEQDSPVGLVADNKNFGAMLDLFSF